MQAVVMNKNKKTILIVAWLLNAILLYSLYGLGALIVLIIVYAVYGMYLAGGLNYWLVLTIPLLMYPSSFSIAVLQCANASRVANQARVDIVQSRLTARNCEFQKVDGEWIVTGKH